MSYKLRVYNELKDQEYNVKSYEQFDSDEDYFAWKQFNIENNSWGYPQREFEYKVQYYAGDLLNNEVSRNLPDEYTDRILSSYDYIVQTDLGYEKHYVHVIMSDYTIYEVDATEEENNKNDKKLLKEQYKIDLKSVDIDSINSVSDLKEVVKKIYEVLLGE